MKKVLIVLVLAVVAFLGLGVIVGNTPEGRERSKDRDAIRACHQKLKDKSVPDSARWLVEGTCEHMEAEFLKKHGRKP